MKSSFFIFQPVIQKSSGNLLDSYLFQIMHEPRDILFPHHGKTGLTYQFFRLVSKLFMGRACKNIITGRIMDRNKGAGMIGDQFKKRLAFFQGIFRLLAFTYIMGHDRCSGDQSSRIRKLVVELDPTAGPILVFYTIFGILRDGLTPAEFFKAFKKEVPAFFIKNVQGRHCN